MPQNAALYQRYKALAEALPEVHFVGRLGTYKYYNMDQVVAQALSVFEKIALKHSLQLKSGMGVGKMVQIEDKSATVEKQNTEAA